MGLIKQLSILSIFFSFHCLNAQELVFEQRLSNLDQNQIVDFIGTDNASFAHADIDGDNDQDIIVSGHLESNVYKNDGNGSFTISQNLGGSLSYGGVEVAFGDIDGDLDIDVLVGEKIFFNDGNGLFTSTTTLLPAGIGYGSVTMGDLDGDKDLDVLIVGQVSGVGIISKLFRNDGVGNFSEIENTGLEGVRYSAIGLADIDNDKDLDILITGSGNTGLLSELYKNDGQANFTLVSSSLVGVRKGSVTFGDIDGDRDLDLIISGVTSGYDRSSKLYKNNGTGVYTEVSGTSFTKGEDSTTDFADIDKDGDLDLIIIGGNGSDLQSELYINTNGLGEYIADSSNNITDIWRGDAMFFDANSDGFIDLIIGGEADREDVVELYLNDKNSHFNYVPGSVFPQLEDGSVVFGDVDGDSDLDVFITGNDKNQEYHSKLFLNDGNGDFTESLGSTFHQNGNFKSACFGDIDGDNDLDLFVNSLYNSVLYKNDGLGNFTEFDGITFEKMWKGTADFIDVDNDNDLDLLLTGTDSRYKYYYSILYENDGTGVFLKVENSAFQGFRNSAVAYSDVDSDSDQDIIICGAAEDTDERCKLYINDGFGVFSQDTVSSFYARELGSADFGDIDNDGDKDILTVGYYGSNTYINIFLNDGSGQFTKDLQSDLGHQGSDSKGGETMFVDIDSDSDLDIIGSDFMFLNDGSGVYSKIDPLPIQHFVYGCIAVADVDNNSKPDILVLGQLGHPQTKLYFNVSPLVTGGKELNPLSTAFFVYPNPTTSDITVSIREDVKEGFIKVFNIHGELIVEQQFSETNVIKLAPNLVSGVYIVTLITADDAFQQKVIKQ